jgi:hypothetical protein
MSDPLSCGEGLGVGSSGDALSLPRPDKLDTASARHEQRRAGTAGVPWTNKSPAKERRGSEVEVLTRKHSVEGFC